MSHSRHEHSCGRGGIGHLPRQRLPGFPAAIIANRCPFSASTIRAAPPLEEAAGNSADNMKAFNWTLRLKFTIRGQPIAAACHRTDPRAALDLRIGGTAQTEREALIYSDGFGRRGPPQNRK